MMHDNAPTPVSKLTHEFFDYERFTRETIMEWPPSSPDLNPIENLWSIVKLKLLGGGKQYSSKTDLCKAIKTIMSEIEPAEVKKKDLTKSMYYRLLAVIEKKGHYIEM